MDKSLTRLQTFYHHLEDEQLLEQMILHEFPGKIALLSSFGADSALLISKIAKIDNNLPILFLETYKHFPETIEYVEKLEKLFNLTNIKFITPSEKLINNIDSNDNLWESQPNRCCWLRKVEPLNRAIAEFDFHAIITGRKAYQTNERNDLTNIEQTTDGLFKINPFFNWDKEKIRSEFITQKLPQHPLIAKGFLSIGCAPCTKPVKEGEDERAGRWAHTGDVDGVSQKTECGIHVPQVPDWSV
ncbi:MAG: phosphoadenylyl-sulfate reductase [Pseudomonadota bacterium]